MQNTILPTGQKQVVNSYPYGRLRTTAFFSIEFVSGRGFRSVFQTINPKNGRLNAEKKSTYYSFMWMEQNPENEYIEFKGVVIHTFEAVNKVSAFIATNEKALDLSKEMIEHICGFMLANIRANAAYSGLDKDKLSPLLDESVKKIMHGFKTGENVFSHVNIDTVAIAELKKEKQAA